MVTDRPYTRFHQQYPTEGVTEQEDPTSARVLDTWIAQAERTIGAASESGRLGWLVGSTVVTAAMQRAVDANCESRFLLKGATLLQHRFGLAARTTRDLDGLVRGDIEISPGEGQAGATPEYVAAPKLAGLGPPSPERLASLALNYQIAQKVHAVTDPHDPPVASNDRARAVPNLLLLKGLLESVGTPTLAQVRAAVHDVFDARAADALALGRTPRPGRRSSPASATGTTTMTWPPRPPASSTTLATPTSPTSRASPTSTTCPTTRSTRGQE